MAAKNSGVVGGCLAAMLAMACSEEPGPTGAKRLDHKALMPALQEAAKPCDQANQRFSALTQQARPDVAAGKAAALAGAEACTAAARQIEALPVSEQLVPVRAACAQAYVAKGSVLEHAGKLDYTVDNPSGLQELQRRATDAEAKIQACLRGAGVQGAG